MGHVGYFTFPSSGLALSTAGFGGQKFMPEVLPKVRALRARYAGLNIEVRYSGTAVQQYSSTAVQTPVVGAEAHAACCMRHDVTRAAGRRACMCICMHAASAASCALHRLHALPQARVLSFGLHMHRSVLGRECKGQ